MNLDALENIYQDIGTKTQSIIPVEWCKVYIYAQVEEGFRSMYFYFYPKNKNVPVYGMDIVDIYSINEDEFDDLFYALLDCFKKLWFEFKKNGQNTWTNLTFILSNNGDLKIDYKYEDLSETDDYEKHIIWRYEYLGIQPLAERKRDVKILEAHLRQMNS